MTIERFPNLYVVPLPDDYSDRLGECYVNALHHVVYDETNALVHGTITGHGYVNPHAWVVHEDGSIYEPTLNRTFHAADFTRFFNPEANFVYTADEAIQLATAHGHYGPWHEEVPT